MSRFVIEVADLVKAECCTTMLHDDMILAIHTVYDQLIEVSLVGVITLNLKRCASSDQIQSRFKKKVATQEE